MTAQSGIQFEKAQVVDEGENCIQIFQLAGHDADKITHLLGSGECSKRIERLISLDH